MVLIKSLVFDKDGVILDLIETWLPVMQSLADYTLGLMPAGADTTLNRAALLSKIGIDDKTGLIDSNGLFARGSFFEIRAVWQTLLPPDMINLQQDEIYRLEVTRQCGAERRIAGPADKAGRGRFQTCGVDQ